MPPKLTTGIKIAPATTGNSRSQPTTSTKKNRVQTACTACKKRKTKCDGNIPACEACKDRETECTYELDNDRRRRNAWMRDTEQLRRRHRILQSILESIQHCDRTRVEQIVNVIRSEATLQEISDYIKREDLVPNIPLQPRRDESIEMPPIASRRDSIGALKRPSDLFLPAKKTAIMDIHNVVDIPTLLVPAKPWTEVIDDSEFVSHLITLYFTWDRPFYYVVDKDLFVEDMMSGQKESAFCTPLLVNAILAHSCQYSNRAGAFLPITGALSKADLFYAEAQRLLALERGMPKLTTAQALAVMSVRDSGSGKDTQGWLYASMCFRMSQDLGLHLAKNHRIRMDVEVRRLQRGKSVAAWGIYCLEKIWFSTLLRPSQLPRPDCPKPSITTESENETWYPYPQVRQTITLKLHTTFDAQCELSQLVDAILRTHFSSWEKVPISVVEVQHQQLMDWWNHLPPTLDPRVNSTPYNLQLLMYFHSVIITLLRSSLSSREAFGTPNPLTPQHHCIDSALEITKILWQYRSEYTVRRCIPFTVHSIFLASVIQLFHLFYPQCSDSFVKDITALHEIGEQWRLARLMLHVLKLISKRPDIDMPQAIREKLFHLAGNLSEDELAELSSCYPVLIGAGRTEEDDGFLGTLSELLGMWDERSAPTQSTRSSVDVDEEMIEADAISSHASDQISDQISEEGTSGLSTYTSSSEPKTSSASTATQ